MKSEESVLSLIAEIEHLVRRFIETGLEARGLTLNQNSLLRFLSRHDYAYPSEAAKALACDRPTTTVVIRNLERKGWVHREVDPENRRHVRVSLTPAGRKKADEVREWTLSFKGSFDPRLGLDAADETELLRLLERVRDEIREHLEELAQPAPSQTKKRRAR